MEKNIFWPLLTLLVLLGCSNPTEPDSKANTTFSISGRITVKETADNRYIVTFKDHAGNWVTTDPYPAGSTPYPIQGGITVNITAEGYVELIDARASTVSTLTVYRNHSAEEKLVSAGGYDFIFYLAENNGNLKYRGDLVRGTNDRVMSVSFWDVVNNVSANKTVTIIQTYLTNSSKTLAFTNPFAIGPSSMTSSPTPILYPNVKNVLFSKAKLDIFLTNDNYYIIDYYDAAGNRLYPSIPDTPVSGAQVLYTSGSYDRLEILADNSIKLTEQEGTGLHQYLVLVNGLTIEMDSTGGSQDYYLRFMDQASGQFKYNANLVQTGPLTYKWQFFNPSIGNVSTQAFWNDDMNIKTYDNVLTLINNAAATNGRVVFQTEYYPASNIREGYLLGCTYTHD
jgi:hypothetical protein